ncbi:hypothetical protein MKW92_047533 [Papaver armeniacum]|nr:hypothetical protein MKW92_047533 [Papaver armeniacum]
MLIEARNIFCQKKLNGNKQSYSREEMEVLRFENSYQQRQIWREICTGLGPIVAKQLNQLAEARQNGKAITDQQQQQQHHHPQPHHQHPRQHQQHNRYPLQSLQRHQYSQQQQQQHHQHPKKPLQHHHHQHQHQLSGLHREDTSILG